MYGLLKLGVKAELHRSHGNRIALSGPQRTHCIQAILGRKVRFAREMQGGRPSSYQLAAKREGRPCSLET